MSFNVNLEKTKAITTHKFAQLIRKSFTRFKDFRITIKDQGMSNEQWTDSCRGKRKRIETTKWISQNFKSKIKSKKRMIYPERKSNRHEDNEKLLLRPL